MIPELNDKVVCVIGVGHVGLPLVHAFGKKLKVIGFDINEAPKGLKLTEAKAAGFTYRTL